MKLKFLYSIFHWVMHILFILVPLSLLNFDFLLIFLSLFAGIIVDLDHLAIAPIKKWKMHFDFDIPRKLPLHNFFVFFITFGLSFIFILNKMIGAVFLGIFLHLLWDLIEDIAVFRMSLNHWRV